MATTPGVQAPQTVTGANAFVEGQGFLGVTGTCEFPPLDIETIESKAGLGTRTLSTGVLKALEAAKIPLATLNNVVWEAAAKHWNKQTSIYVRWNVSNTSGSGAAHVAHVVTFRGNLTKVPLPSTEKGKELEQALELIPSFYKYEVDGTTMFLVDLDNLVFEVNGTDLYEEIRANLQGQPPQPSALERDMPSIKLTKPLEFKGKTLTSLSPDFAGLSGATLELAADEFAALNPGYPGAEYTSMKYAAIVAAMACGLDSETVRQLPAKDYLKLVSEAQGFLFEGTATREQSGNSASGQPGRRTRQPWISGRRPSGNCADGLKKSPRKQSGNRHGQVTGLYNHHECCPDGGNRAGLIRRELGEGQPQGCRSQ